MSLVALTIQGLEVAQRYAIVQKIGAGGMSSVWLAYE